MKKASAMLESSENASEFDAALLGNHCWLESALSGRTELAVDRWSHEASQGDYLLLDRCIGPTLDVGCGPGRLTSALGDRGVVCLGIDSSATAIDLTIKRGGIALQRNIFDRLPAEGRWRHVLLVDGNIGIGGDPVALLCRMGELLCPAGSVLVELDSPGRSSENDNVRLRRPGHRPGNWFPWSWLGVDDVVRVARAAGWAVSWTKHHELRWFAELVRL